MCIKIVARSLAHPSTSIRRLVQREHARCIHNTPSRHQQVRILLMHETLYSPFVVLLYTMTLVNIVHIVSESLFAIHPCNNSFLLVRSVLLGIEDEERLVLMLL